MSSHMDNLVDAYVQLQSLYLTDLYRWRNTIA